MDRKLGIYLCSGCGLGAALDLEKLSHLATEELHLPARTHPCLCGPAGVQLIRSDMELQGIDTPVIAACSPRVNADTFTFTGGLVERVNLREQGVWSHSPGDEDSQMLAEDCLWMGVARARKREPPQPLTEKVARSILVVGGGATGISAALESARAGYDVALVEKAPSLGGWLRCFHQLTPQQAPYGHLQETGLAAQIQAIEAHPRIQVFTSAEVETISGQPGQFEARVRQDGQAHDLATGSIIQATGWQPYDAARLDNLGSGRYPNVITSLHMEEMARKGKIICPSNGREPGSVAFVLCAGSRDERHLSYCSGVCCSVSLKQALYIREMEPTAAVYILYRDMRTPGLGEDFYRRVQEEEGIFLARGEVTGVSQDGEGSLLLDVENSILGERVGVRADLVVLAIGMVPSSDGLHLQYRQGPELPALEQGFPDSHFLCFPYETRRTAIFAAGCARQPMNVASSIEDGAGAALKAIQALELLAQGAALHPRVGDLSYPNFFLQRCTQCKRCTEECPFGALDEDEKGTPRPHPLRCRRCGICMGACPERLVSFADYSIDQLAAMVKAIHVPDPEEDKPRLLAFVCENDAYPAFDLAGINHIQYDPNLRLIPVRCLGSLNVVLIADAISRGIDGILLIGCYYGKDYQCHFIQGSELANKRMENVKETLGRLRVEPERVKVVQLAISDYARIPEIVNGFASELKKIGPNPYKGF